MLSVGVGLLLIVVLGIGACNPVASDTDPSGETSLEVISDRRTPVVEAGTEGYANFRIPVLVEAPNGDLLLFCEARATKSDFGNIDIVQIRSTDGGHTWNAPTLVADNGTDTAADPAVVVGEGRVHLLYQKRPGARTFQDYLEGTASDAHGIHIASEDNGQTWSAPDTITSQVLPWGNEQLPMFGPNNGIQLESGRLVVPMYYANQSTNTFTPAVIYSDDGGETWTRSEDAVTGESVNETAVVQVPNGDLFAVARDGSDDDGRKRYFRSVDQGETWAETGNLDSVIPGVWCQQSMRARGNQLFLAGPRTVNRSEGQLWTGTYDPSQPGAVNWHSGHLQLTEGGFAYSSMVVRNSTIDLVYEEKTEDGYESLRHVQVRAPVLADSSNENVAYRRELVPDSS